jgi:acetylornithine/N-succinyldiaminopimelate aminotransferase
MTRDSAFYKELAARHVMHNYGVRDIVLVRGQGTRVWDADGKEYLDFLSGISVANLGHCPPAVVEAIHAQASTLMHCSNLYLIPQQAELAEKLCALSFADRCFFANSGAEVNEGAIKLARLYAKKKLGPDRHEVITMRNSFHGRTLAMITATGQEKVQKGFDPLMPGFRYATLNDLASVREQVNDKTCAIMLEPVQGEGGITPATREFLQGLRALCSERGLLLIYDEIQCGLGRCGTMFAYEALGVEPDMMTLAKSLGCGYPVAVLMAREEIAAVFEQGTHGSTFGGNPVAMAAALAVLKVLDEQNIPARAKAMGEYFRARLADLCKHLDTIKEIRGLGLMIGVELTHPGSGVVKGCAARGLLVNCTMGNVIRLLPPLIVTEKECDHAAAILAEVFGEERELQLKEKQQTGEKS